MGQRLAKSCGPLVVLCGQRMVPGCTPQKREHAPALQNYAFGAWLAGAAGACAAGDAGAAGAACGADAGCAPPGVTARGAWVPAALPAKGISAMLRARLMATPSQRWCREHTPVIRRGRILPRSCTNCERMSARL